MKAEPHLDRAALGGRVIDSHSHLGVGLKYYVCQEYPYAQTVEGLRYRQRAAGVDANVVFPASGSLYFEPAYFGAGEMRPAAAPISPAPYALENEVMLVEIFHYNREECEHFIPFVMADPGREVTAQIEHLLRLEEEYPIYGIKISPVDCQSPVTDLLAGGGPLLAFAAERNIPILLHTTVDPEERYSHASLCFEVIEGNPHLRFCLAHCIGFDAAGLERANALPNVWVDSSALTIQVQCARENNRIIAPESARFDADYTDHTSVLCSLMDRYPDTMLWGSDSPWYTFICRRKQGEGSYLEFRLKARYEDEKAALDALSDDLRVRACNSNTLRFLFGE
jgi:predicted TIM-barrel fold metal-dependent hydrolase